MSKFKYLDTTGSGIARHEASGQTAQLIIDRWQQLLGSVLFPAPHSLQYLGHIAHGCFHAMPTKRKNKNSKQSFRLQTIGG